MAVRRRADLTAITDLRADVSPPTVKRRTRKDKAEKHRQSAMTRPFISWDGEATQDAGYCLLGNSTGTRIKRPYISTRDMLELILQTGADNPRAFHVAFSFDYDVNNILWEIPFHKIAVLNALNHVRWEEYEIMHIPHKMFKVTKFNAEKKVVGCVRIDDIFSFFNARYDRVLEKFNVGTPELRQKITDGKENRNEFYWSDIDDIEHYWELELDTMVELMNMTRRDMNDAGFYITSWHGPGALAKYALKKNKMNDYRKPLPKEMELAVRSAYAGGWFERYKAGHHDGPVYTADINSAYAYGLTLLPDLKDGRWEHVENPDPSLATTTDFALFHIRWDNPVFDVMSLQGLNLPLPLFHRAQDGSISHPSLGDGWYWNPEAALAAKYLTVGGLKCEFVEAWVYTSNGDKPFSWVYEMYEERLALQALGNPAEKALKWTLASLYGSLAQRAGWRRTKSAPQWHQLEWAGWITSKCRAMIFEAAIPVARQGGLVSIDTDGVTSTVPFAELENGTGTGLGQWKVESFTGLIYIQNGIYWLKDENGEWLPPKLRGIPRKKLDPQVAFDALKGDGVITSNSRHFIGYGAALMGRRAQWRTWIDSEHKVNVNYGSHRLHSPKACRACKRGDGMDKVLHDLFQPPLKPGDLVSKPHDLPWLGDYDKELREKLHKIIDDWL